MLVAITAGAVAVGASSVWDEVSPARNGAAPVRDEASAPAPASPDGWLYFKTIYLNETPLDSLCDIEALHPMDNDIKAFLRKWEIHGASLAIMRNDSLVYAKGYGWADEEKGLRMRTTNILRLASVSKLITATGIMVLKEQGLLSLQDKVFGPDGILSDSEFTAAVRDRRIFNITVEDLLRHKGGFSSAVYGDPMFSARKVAQRYNFKTPPDSRTLTRALLSERLQFTPGTSQSYSNFGYLVLSLVIEKLSGMAYEDFINEYVLWPAGCHDFQIAGNYYEDRHPNESRYYMHRGVEKTEDFHGNGKMVEKCYGGNNISGLSGAGAWCASPVELCRFVAAIDGRDGIFDIISWESVSEMTEYFDPDTYSLGWNDTKPTGEWTRTGSFSGTSALIKCYPDGECWILVTNTSTYRGAGFSRYSSALFRECREKYSHELPHINLFYPKP